jgi:hypothetical protein
MIKKLLFAASIFVVASSTAQTTSFSLYYPFTSVQGTVALITVDPTTAPTTTGVTSGSWTAVGTGTGSTTNGVFSFVGWGTGATSGNDNYGSYTGAIDLNKYYEMVLTPQANYGITLNSMSFGATRSGTGVRNWAVRTNKDGYVSNIAATYTPQSSAASSPTIPVTVLGGNIFFWQADAVVNPAAFATYNMCGVNFSGPSYSMQATPYNIRIYAWNAEGTTGTFRIDTLTINGSATFSIGVGLNKVSHDLNAKIKLYPNPTNDGVAILETSVNDYSKIEVLNMLGAVVASQNNTGLVDDKIKLNLATLPVGTYFVRITAPAGIITEKLIITK